MPDNLTNYASLTKAPQALIAGVSCLLRSIVIEREAVKDAAEKSVSKMLTKQTFD
jgi:hypothetical protein